MPLSETVMLSHRLVKDKRFPLAQIIISSDISKYLPKQHSFPLKLDRLLIYINTQ